MKTDKQYYTTANGTSYDINTDKKIVSILDDAIINRKRLKLDYGNTETGESWNECYDIIGGIGRSIGSIKIPLLILTSRSYKGGALLDSCIIKITDVKTGNVIYKNQNYKEKVFNIVPSDLPDYTVNVNINGKLYSRHKSERSAKMLISKLS